MFLLLKELLQPDGLPAPTHPLGRGVFNETPSRIYIYIYIYICMYICASEEPRAHNGT